MRKLSNLLEDVATLDGAIQAVRTLRSIKRCGTFYTAQPQNVAEHSYFTALFAMLLCRQCCYPLIWISFERDVIAAALFHDLGEAVTGDVRWQIKQSNSTLATLEDSVKNTMLDTLGMREMPQAVAHPDVALVVDAADMLEFVMTGLDELQLTGRLSLDFANGVEALNGLLLSLVARYGENHSPFGAPIVRYAYKMLATPIQPLQSQEIVQRCLKEAEPWLK